MMYILIMLGLIKETTSPTASVTIDTAEIEAIFVPFDYTGPIVAIPADAAVFITL
jgi:hypothetical protein